jgi:hypothetical protein
MIAGRDLTLVTEREESWRAFEAFERAFAAAQIRFDVSSAFRAEACQSKSIGTGRPESGAYS